MKKTRLCSLFVLLELLYEFRLLMNMCYLIAYDICFYLIILQSEL